MPLQKLNNDWVFTGLRQTPPLQTNAGQSYWDPLFSALLRAHPPLWKFLCEANYVPGADEATITKLENRPVGFDANGDAYPPRNRDLLSTAELWPANEQALLQQKYEEATSVLLEFQELATANADIWQPGHVNFIQNFSLPPLNKTCFLKCYYDGAPQLVIVWGIWDAINH
jgi:hypothetical protein